MLNNLIEEVRSRRVLALAALGVLVALALPLLFLKGGTDNVPAADTAAPAAPAEAKLPPRAARLLATTDAGAVRGRAKGSSQDPFSPPAAYRAAAAAQAAKAAGSTTTKTPAATNAGGASVPSKPIPVVIRNADGSSTSKAGTTSHRSRSGSSHKSSSAPKAAGTRTVAVDVRFGAKKDSRLRRAIAPNQGFYIHGRLVAMFVRYSPSRHKAIFAVAPNLHISGPVKCRVVNNACRYLDIPAGSHARLATIIDNRTVVSRRLDVVHTRSHTASTPTRATVASDRADAGCLLRKLTAMQPADALIARDACER
jgi:hypothetical protein